MIFLPPWTSGPFELIVHAEIHLREARDFDRRIALISYDNAIEIAITTYLGLNPLQRGGREYPREDVDRWLRNYHTKLDFFEKELQTRGIACRVDMSHIIWAHDARNEQYHGGSKGGIPDQRTLAIARTSAIWIFSVLFDVPDAEDALEQAVRDQTPPAAPSREKRLDMAIDERHGILEVGEQSYYTSELLFAVDYAAYRELGGKLCDFADELTGGDEDEAEP